MMGNRTERHALFQLHFEGQTRRLHPQGVCRAVPDASHRPLRKANDADSANGTAITSGLAGVFWQP